MARLQKHSVNDRSKPERCPPTVSGGLDIFVSSTCLILPMTILTVGFIVYVVGQQIRWDEEQVSLLKADATILAKNHLYVRADSTTLIFVASWMSSIAPLLTGFAITLATFPTAQRLMKDTKSQDRVERLPTAYQVHLLLKLINGSTWTGLWSLALYSLGWKHRKDRICSALVYLTWTAICFMFLSAAIFLVDTWLHIATKTVPLTQTSPLVNHDALYGLASIPSCTASNNSYVGLRNSNTTCTLSPAFELPVLSDPAAVIQTVNDQSQSTSVRRIAEHDLSLLTIASDTLRSSDDFLGSSYALETTCSPISQACGLSNNGNVTFNCSGGSFSAEGDIMNRVGLAIQVFKYADFSDVEDPFQYYGVQNPFYVAGASINGVSSDSPLREDPRVVATKAIVSAVFTCRVTVLDLEYTSIEGRLEVISTKVSNHSTTNMFVTGIAAAGFGLDNMKADMNMAGILAIDAQDLADRFGQTLSKVILSTGASSVHQVPAEAAQRRSEVLVACVPKAPFFLLIATNFGFVLLGVGLAFVAMLTPPEGRNAQRNLTIAGIVANLLDRDHARRPVSASEQLYGEYHGVETQARVGIDRTSQGGFVLGAVLLQDLPLPEEDEPRDGLLVEDRRRTVESLLPRQSYGPPAFIDEATIRQWDRRSWVTGSRDP